MNAILLSLGAFLSTFGGGLFALRFHAKLPYILSFTAGVLLGVVSFDILPETFELATASKIDPINAMIALVVGFLVFHAMERYILLHHAHEGDYAVHKHPRVGVMSALALAE